MKKLLLILSFIASFLPNYSQEFDCQINVSTAQIEGTDKRVFESLQSSLYEFFNNRKWSGYNIKSEERIQISLLLTLNERIGSDEFKGTLNIVLKRPVLNSAYNTTLLNYIDKNIQIRYVEYQPLDYSDGTFSSNLTSIFAYYAYVCLGFYFDSFSPNGGSPFFEKANTVVQSAQNAQEAGWKAYESTRNRFWMVENMQNSGNASLREFSYQYNRLGLDALYEKLDQGRGTITESLEMLRKVYNAKPDLFMLQLTIDSKRDELVNIYSDQRVPPLEKTNIVNLMKEIDPANGSKYQAILESK